MKNDLHRKLPCELRERLYTYVTQTMKALVEAQERGLTDMLPSFLAGQPYSNSSAVGLISAARAWKEARRLYEKHVHEHGCSVCSVKAVAA